MTVYSKLLKVSFKMMLDIIHRLEKDSDKRLKLYDYYHDKLKCASDNILSNSWEDIQKVH